MATEDRVGSTDRALLRGAAAGKSPDELSAITNGVVSPAAAAQRVRDILSSRDWLSDVEKYQLFIDDLMALKDKLMQQAVDWGQTKDAAGPLIRVLALLEKSLSNQKLDVDAAMQRIDEAHGRIMLEAINLALERALFELEKRHPEVPSGELRELLAVSFPAAVVEIESHALAIEA